MTYEELKNVFKTLPNAQYRNDILSIIDNCEKNGLSSFDAFCKLSVLFNNKEMKLINTDEMIYLKHKI